jgi:Uma2 family endonuclease
MAAALKIPDFLSVDAFLGWDAPIGQLWQLVDAVPQAMAPASPTHGQIQSEVAALIRNHLIATGSPCFVVVSPGVIPRVQSDINMRIPDLAVTCTPALPTDKALRDPVLLIEILSPSNRAETWSNVWSYTTIPSVREILVLHSSRIGADLLRRDADGTWPERPLAIEKDNVVLDSIGYTGAVAAFYRSTWLHHATAAPAGQQHTL